ncbi:MAG: ATP synthase F1 subunit delta [Planctomycetes bacterium]|nr:ATP synthase F1 subunit delta [Planctomycetota bacterium]MCP4771629.1 ATP synthase F1 subunit delta [Planctomycetota bacterium]MCP4860071.1 ATP synthase F1 subunit delta [Planctomycetota bacterium]
MSSTHVSSAARRYGRALFEVALEQGSLDAVRADMKLLGTVLAEATTAAALADPRLDDQQKRAMLDKALGEYLHEHTSFLLGVLEKRTRLALLAQIPAAFEELLDAHEGRLRGELESARPLSDEDRMQVEAALSEKTGKKVSLETSVDETLLGGIRVTLAGTRYDGSAKGRLDGLRQRLENVELV